MSLKTDAQYTTYELSSRDATPSQENGTANDAMDMERMGKRQELRVRAKGHIRL